MRRLMIDRYDAVVAMQKVAIDDKRDILIDLYDKQNYHAIREEIIAQLANDDHKKSIALLKRALKDTDINVRRAVVTNLKTLPKKWKRISLPCSTTVTTPMWNWHCDSFCEQDKEHAEKYLEHCADKYGAAKTSALPGWNILMPTEISLQHLQNWPNMPATCMSSEQEAMPSRPSTD